MSGSCDLIREVLIGALAGVILASCGSKEKIVQLKKDTGMTRQIAAGESHDYELPMEADQLVQVVAHQLGVDVALALYDPDGNRILEVDSPTGRQGPERLLAVAETAGTYRLVVRAVEKDAPTGSYRLLLKELGPVSSEDRRRAAAERTFSRAEALFLEEEGTKESLQAAAELYQAALVEWQEVGDREREADAQLRLGWVHRDLKESADAIAFLEAARELYREVGEGPGEGMALNSLGGVWIRLRENREALPLIEQAVEIAIALDHSLLKAESFNNLGIVLNRLGRTDAAIEAYTEARKLYQELGEPRHLARIGANLGFLFAQRGKLEDAADNLEQAVEIRKQLGQLRQAGIALSILGDVRKRQGRLDDALQDLEEALALRRQVGDRDGEARTLNTLGTTHLLRRELEEARSRYQEARETFEEIGNVGEQAVTLVNLGRLAVEAGDPQGALDLHRWALPLIDSDGDPTLAASNLYGMAKALHDLGDFEAARQQLEETLGKVEELRSETRSEGLRIAFFATRQHYYELYIDVLMHLEDEAGAFAAADERRARALFEALGEHIDAVRQHASPELLEKERTLQGRLNDLERRRVALLRQHSPDEDQIAEIRKEQRATVFELDLARAQLRSELIRAPTSSLAEVQSLLAPGVLLGTPGPLLLAYSLGDERSFLWRVSHQGIASHVLPGRREIEAAASEALRLLTSRRPGAASTRTRILAELSEMLLGPIAEELDGQRLLILAEGALLHLPFAALPGPPGMRDAPDYLVRRHETVYLPSISVLRTLRERLLERYPAPKQLAIFADPVFVRPGKPEVPNESDGYENKDLQRSVEALGVPRLQPLPRTRDEAEAILDLARGEVMSALGFEATKKRVLEGGLDQYKILHFATHGLIQRQQPELSGLVLSLFNESGESLDGFLRLHEIYNLDLAAEMVVLSACQTGSGREVRGEGLLGLTRGFFYAGAPRLVVSLWKVADVGTAELMKRFYWNLLEGKAPPPLALRAAQRAMLGEEEWSHPYYWAGFVFQGEWWPPGEEPPIGGSQAGGIDEDPNDPDYPGPSQVCENLPEPWMRDLCKQLRELAGG